MRSTSRCRLLVTGFEPFGEHTQNPSALLAGSVRAAPNAQWEPARDAPENRGSMQSEQPVLRPDRETVSYVLPTAYAAAEVHVLELLERHQPRFVLHLGLAANRPSLSLELNAKNLDDSSARDNAGEIRTQQRIDALAPPLYAASLPQSPLVQLANDLREPVRFSRDAGGFVCNHVFFTSLNWANTAGKITQIGFVHVPNVSPEEPRYARLFAVLQVWVAHLTSCP